MTNTPSNIICLPLRPKKCEQGQKSFWETEEGRRWLEHEVQDILAAHKEEIYQERLILVKSLEAELIAMFRGGAVSDKRRAYLEKLLADGLYYALYGVSHEHRYG